MGFGNQSWADEWTSWKASQWVTETLPTEHAHDSALHQYIVFLLSKGRVWLSSYHLVLFSTIKSVKLRYNYLQVDRNFANGSHRLSPGSHNVVFFGGSILQGNKTGRATLVFRRFSFRDCNRSSVRDVTDQYSRDRQTIRLVVFFYLFH